MLTAATQPIPLETNCSWSESPQLVTTRVTACSVGVELQTKEVRMLYNFFDSMHNTKLHVCRHYNNRLLALTHSSAGSTAGFLC